MVKAFRTILILFFGALSLQLEAQEELVKRAGEAKSRDNFQAAYKMYQEAAEAYHNANDVEAYVGAYLQMVDCQLQDGDPFVAKRLAENVLSYLDDLPDQREDLRSEAQIYVGLSQLSLGRSEEALEVLQQAEQKLPEEESAISASCYGALGQTYRTLYNTALSVQYHEKALRTWRSVKGRDALEVGNEFNNLGLVYTQEEPLQALVYFRRAEPIYKKQLLPDHRKLTLLYINMALAHKFLENYDESLELLNQVKSIYDAKYPEDHPNKAFILSSIGRVQLDKGETQAALASQNQALQMYLRMFGQRHPDVANTYFLIGDIYQKEADFRLAVTYYQQSIYANFADQHPSNNYSLPTLENYFNADILLSSLRAKGIALEALHYEKTLNTMDLVASVATYQLCDELISVLRRQRLSEGDKIKLGEIAKEVYDNGIRLSLILSEQTFKRGQYLKLAFEFCERSKAAVLLEAITETKAKQFAGIPENLLLLEDSLKDEISFLERKLAEPENTEDQQLKDLLFRYQNEYRTFIGALEADYPNYYNLKYSHQLASVAEVQEKLTERSALLSYFIGQSQVYIFVITKKSVKAHRVTKDGGFDRLANGFRNAIKYDVKDAFLTTASEFHELLIPQLPKAVKELIILPDGILGTIPFEAFVEPKNEEEDFRQVPFLVRRYYVSYEYSGTLFTQKPTSRSLENPGILLVAPVDFSKNEVQMQALPGSEKEVADIRFLFIGNSCPTAIQVKDNASEGKLKSEVLDEYNYIHFATHGYVNESEPALSKIFLSPDEQEDGSLYTGEIYNLNINADLVTLSACETGLGKVAKGEGVVGLSRALQYAGAKNIMVSLWQVADASTAELMIEFYKFNLFNPDQGYNAALRHAKLQLLDSSQYNRPFYWAPFILVGK